MGRGGGDGCCRETDGRLCGRVASGILDGRVREELSDRSEGINTWEAGSVKTRKKMHGLSGGCG